MVVIRKPFNGDYLITQGFGENPQLYKQFGKPGHNGIDYGLPLGTPIVAAAAGSVAKISFEASGYGMYVLLQHNGYQTLYAHLQKIVVQVRDAVKEGQQIALSGNSGFSTGPHLHFELRIPGHSGAYNRGEVDPLQYMIGEKQVQAMNQQVMGNKGPGEYVVAVESLNVRKGPGLDAPIIGQLLQGEQVRVNRFVGDWAELAVYVYGDYLTSLRVK